MESANNRIYFLVYRSSDMMLVTDKNAEIVSVTELDNETTAYLIKSWKVPGEKMPEGAIIYAFGDTMLKADGKDWTVWEAHAIEK